MARPAFRYSRWDGSQRGFDLDADQLLDEMADDLLYHGDLNAALRRLMQQGLRDRNGERMPGLREMLERLRERRREMLERRDLGGVYDDINRRLDEIVDHERTGIDRANIPDAEAHDHRRQLDELSPDLAGRVRDLQQYDFVDPAARQEFEQLVDDLRQQMLQSTFNRMQQGMQNMSPQQMQRMKDMLASLNQMLEARANGEEPDFRQFMQQYGDFFPGNPQSLDELLQQMAESMARMQQLLNSMSPEQRQQLQELMNSLMDDIDLQWQLDELGRNLAQAFPDLPWNASFDFNGDNPLSMGELPGLLQQLGDLDDLEHLLQEATEPGMLAEADLDRVRDLLGDDAAQALERLRELAKMLEEAGLVDRREGRLELSPRAIRALGNKALNDLYRRLLKDRAGAHRVERAGSGHERSDEHKTYEFGDPFHLDVGRTVRNAVMRSGPGTPVQITPDDFEIERTEHSTTVSTVLLLDVSYSMFLRDRFLAAKKMAMALQALIRGQFPRDHFGLVSFGFVARDVSADRLPEVSWDLEWGTNMHHALLLARRQLARHSGTKQIIMVTDGEPTAHLMEDDPSHPFFDYPPRPETIEATLREVARCTRDGIRINTFMLEDSSYLRHFVEQMTRMNKGRAFFVTPENLGDYVLMDFLEGRTASRRSA
ncbi:MAG: VWA domain-containing protein [Acidimicrobiia bacterium]